MPDVVSASLHRSACWASARRQLAPAATPEAYDPWPGLVQDIFNNRPMNDGAGVIAIEMPYRAEDAAIVPVTSAPPFARRQSACEDHAGHRQIPAPMAARFELGPDANVTEISTRVRVDSYTDFTLWPS